MLPIIIKHNAFRNLDCSDNGHKFETVVPSFHLMEDRGIREKKKITNFKILEAWIEKNNTFHDENKIEVESFFLKVQDISEKCFHFVGAQLQPNQELALPEMVSCTLTTQELLDKLSGLNLVFKFNLTNQKNPASWRDMTLI